VTSQKKNQTTRKFKFKREKCSIQQKVLRGKRNHSYPFFLLFLVVFSSFCFSSPILGNILATFPQDEQNPRISEIVKPTYVAKYPLEGYSGARGLAMRDDYLYTIIGYNPTIIDVSNASKPTLVAEYEFEDGRLNTLALREDYLYLGGTYGLEILDISNLANITKVGVYNTTTADQIWTVALKGDFAYLAAEDNGLVIVNVSDPSQPEEVGSFTSNLRATDIALMGSYAFVTNFNETGNPLVIMDVSNPENPIEIGHFEDEVYEEMPGLGISINGSYAYLGTSGYGFFIINITDIYNPIRVGHFYGGSESIGGFFNNERVKDIFIHKHYAFEAAGPNGLYILDVSNPSNPILVGDYQGHYLFGLHLHETYLYLVDLLDGIFILKITYHSTTPLGLPIGTILALIITPLGFLVLLSVVIPYWKKKN